MLRATSLGLFPYVASFSFAFAYIIAISVPMCQAVSDFKLP